jgi:hypothetical protein
MGRPEDVANLVSFLASDEASFITGQTIFICGGITIETAPFQEILGLKTDIWREKAFSDTMYGEVFSKFRGKRRKRYGRKK